MSDVTIQKRNEVYLTVDCEPHIKYELSEYFTFEVPGAKFMPAYKKRLWDGTIKLFSPGDGKIYCGLYEYLTEWLDQRDYTYEDLENKFYGLPRETNDFISPQGIADYVKHLNIPFKVRDYQYNAIFQALKYNRRLLLSPTASGKSTFVNKEKEALGAIVADSDDIKKLLPEFTNGANANGVHVESSIINYQIMKIASKNGDNIIYPTTGRFSEKLQKVISNAEKEGYTVKVKLMFLLQTMQVQKGEGQTPFVHVAKTFGSHGEPLCNSKVKNFVKYSKRPIRRHLVKMLG